MHVKKQESYFICRYHEDTVRLPHHSILQCAPRGHAVDDTDLPSLVDQDELSISTAGYEEEFSIYDSLPDLVYQSVSAAQYDSEDAFSLGEDEYDDFILEGTFGAQVTFVDDANNMITLGSDNDGEGIVDPTSFQNTEISNIALRHSNSDLTDEDDLLQEQILDSITLKVGSYEDVFP
jgi:hypothetical protein